MEIDAVKRMNHILELHKKKSFIPVWGEMFSVIWELKKSARKNKRNIILYDLPDGDVMYDYKKNVFTVRTNDLHFNLKDYEFVNSLLEGRFF